MRWPGSTQKSRFGTFWLRLNGDSDVTGVRSCCEQSYNDVMMWNSCRAKHSILLVPLMAASPSESLFFNFSKLSSTMSCRPSLCVALVLHTVRVHSWTWVGSIHGMEWVESWNSTNTIFWCKVVVKTSTFLLSHCSPLPVNIIIISTAPIVNRYSRSQYRQLTWIWCDL